MFSDKFPPDLLDEIIPLVEKTYRVYNDADHRAIAGLSMGGGQALRIGLENPDVFHWVLGFSAAIGGQFGDTEQLLQKVVADPAGYESETASAVDFGREAGFSLSGRQAVRGSAQSEGRERDL